MLIWPFQESAQFGEIVKLIAVMPWSFETKINGVPGSIGAGEMVEFSPGRLVFVASWFDRSEPARPFFVPVTNGILHSKQMTIYSLDGGRTLTPWRQLATRGLKGCSINGPGFAP